jgi:hypothetical protein
LIASLYTRPNGGDRIRSIDRSESPFELSESGFTLSIAVRSLGILLVALEDVFAFSFL